MGLVELDADGEGMATFLIPTSRELKLGASRPQKADGRGGGRGDDTPPLREGPGCAAEEDACKNGLAWKLSERLADLVGDEWRRETLYVIPDPPGAP